MAQQRQLIDFDSFGAHTILKTGAITSVPGNKMVRIGSAYQWQKDAKGDNEHTQASCKCLIITSYQSFLMMYLLVCQFDE